MLTLNVFNLSRGQNCKNSSYEFLYKRQWGIKGRLEMFEQYTLLFMCKSHLKCLHSFIIIIYINLFTFKFRQAKTLCK